MRPSATGGKGGLKGNLRHLGKGGRKGTSNKNRGTVAVREGEVPGGEETPFLEGPTFKLVGGNDEGIGGGEALVINRRQSVFLQNGCP